MVAVRALLLWSNLALPLPGFAADGGYLGLSLSARATFGLSRQRINCRRRPAELFTFRGSAHVDTAIYAYTLISYTLNPAL